MKIIKLPDMIDPSYLIKKTIKEKNITCPFCDEKEHLWDWLGHHRNGYGGICNYAYKSFYGKKNRKLFEKKHQWRIDCYKCYTCGAKWETDAYPTDITGIK